MRSVKVGHFVKRDRWAAAIDPGSAADNPRHSGSVTAWNGVVSVFIDPCPGRRAAEGPTPTLCCSNRPKHVVVPI